MVGIWCVAAWQQLGCPPSLHLVELGPGRGTLMADLLRGTAAFPAFAAALRVSLVEVSPVLRRMQWDALRCGGSGTGPPPTPAGDQQQQQQQQPGGDQQQQASGSSIPSGGSGSSGGSAGAGEPPLAGVSGWCGARVSWHRSLDEVQPEGGPALYIAHEFLDALPVHQFQRTGEYCGLAARTPAGWAVGCLRHRWAGAQPRCRPAASLDPPLPPLSRLQSAAGASGWWMWPPPTRRCTCAWCCLRGPRPRRVRCCRAACASCRRRRRSGCRRSRCARRPWRWQRGWRGAWPTTAALPSLLTMGRCGVWLQGGGCVGLPARQAEGRRSRAWLSTIASCRQHTSLPPP